MKDIVTKENWSSDPNNAPLPSDFNRIESNIRKVEENRQEETTARQNADSAEATARANADSAEATARANADSAEASARSTGDTNTFNSVFSALYTTGGVGSLAFLWTLNGDALEPGATILGSRLAYCSVGTSGIYVGVTPISPSGTWRCLGRTDVFAATLYIRIS